MLDRAAMINRRTLLAVIATVPILALPACTPADTTPSQLATDVTLITAGLAASIASIKQIPGVPSAAMIQLDRYLLALQAGAATIKATSGPPATQAVQQIVQLVQAVASVALPLIPGGSAIQTTVMAALSLLPVLLATVGVAGTGMSARFTPAQARLILTSSAEQSGTLAVPAATR